MSSSNIAMEVELSPSEGVLTALEASLVGQLKSIDSLETAGTLSKLEGWPEFRISYLGGLTILLDFTSKAVAREFLEEAEETWRDWFSLLSSWSSQVIPTNRIAVLDIQGLPIHVWNQDSAYRIGQLWGEVLKLELDKDLGIN